MDDEYRLSYFVENDFIRKECRKCGSRYWTRDPARETCGDVPCELYSFIDNPIFKAKEIDEMRELFLSFFEHENHKRMDRYPIIARWRDDIYLTIASIAAFQPWVTSGKVPPPANPLTISQPCIRLDDIHSVGRSGRHLTMFEMLAHHAFNKPNEKEVYWKEETVEYCSRFLNSLGIKSDDVTYKEVMWSGGGNAGPCLEVCVGGLEIATLVFMNLGYSPVGDIVIDGERYKKIDSYIVDTGYGLERFVWASKGSPTVYDAIFPDVIDELVSLANIDHVLEEHANLLSQNARLAALGKEKVAEHIGIKVDELRRILEPIESVYAIADHARCLLFMLGDGVIPSNVKAGYLARLVIRRMLRMLKSLGIDVPLKEVVRLHLEAYTEFIPRMDGIAEIIDLEEKRYAKTIKRGGRLIKSISMEYGKSGGRVPLEEIIGLYDTHGIPPELTEEVASEMNVHVDIPDNFYSLIASSHSKREREYDPYTDLVKDLPGTRRLYYDELNAEGFEAVVLDVIDYNGHIHIVLDQTLFYPEGGGQPSDKGVFSTREKVIAVTDVRDVNGVVLHRVEEEIARGELISGRIDFKRRKTLSRNHTATHILLSAAKDVLGEHIWQSGAQKGVDQSRLDVSHYKRISPEELEEIERVANRIVMINLPVRISMEDRNDAEKKYGFILYQGGVPPGEKIRIVRVGDDVQACAGTHCSTTGEVGCIKILRCTSVQDGVERIEFAVGDAAISAIQHEHRILRDSANILRVPTDLLSETTSRFFNEWKVLKRENERLMLELMKSMADRMMDAAEDVEGTRLIARQVDLDMEELTKLASELSKRDIVGILFSAREKEKAKVVVSVPPSGISRGMRAVSIIKPICDVLGGGGGGKPELAQGGGPRTDKIHVAIQEGKKLIRSYK